MAVPDVGPDEAGQQQLLPADATIEAEPLSAHATEWTVGPTSIEVPVVYATIQDLASMDDDHVLRALRCVTVEANIAVAETVSVALSSYRDPDGESGGYRGMVFFDLTPSDAVVLAAELRRAAEESVAPCGCGRTFANRHEYSDVCPLSGPGSPDRTTDPGQLPDDRRQRAARDANDVRRD